MNNNKRSIIAGLVVTILVAAAGCTPDGFLIIPVSHRQSLTESTLRSEGWFAPKIAVIDVDGVITNASGPALLSDGENPVSLLLEKLDQAGSDPAVRAVILRINSPGGAVAASEYMHEEIVRFRRQTGKPVVAQMMDLAASGGYYIACACDEIAAHQSTVTGSIGVIVQLFDVTGTMAKIGVRPTTIRSGDLKAGGNPFQQLSPAERANFERIVHQMYQQFIEVVDQGRPNLSNEQVRALADGRVFTAPDALEAGLIDRIATMTDTIEHVKEMIGAKRVQVVSYHRPLGYSPNYYAEAGRQWPPRAQVNLISLDLPSWMRPYPAQFMYLWLPQ